MEKKKVLVGMSGGVDSSVTAGILVEQGYSVKGMFVEAYNEPGCRTDQDKKDALQVALKLGISFEVLDLRQEYKKTVVKYFLNEYKAGRTPNPDIVCNREVKFGLLYDYAIKNGFDYLATGHYARIVKQEDRQLLKRPYDLEKDQTYFLWQVAGERLERVMFPLGELRKEEVREKAHKLGLPNADKPDSMGVCMIGELNVAKFLRSKLGEKRGEVIIKGKRVGEHQGLWFYTLGQRVGGNEIVLRANDLKSISIDTTKMPPLYVVAKNSQKNELIVGRREECYTKEIRMKNLEVNVKEERLWARIRNLGELVEVERIIEGIVMLKQSIFAPAPGQSMVFYTSQGIVAGGGIIG